MKKYITLISLTFISYCSQIIAIDFHTVSHPDKTILKICQARMLKKTITLGREINQTAENNNLIKFLQKLDHMCSQEEDNLLEKLYSLYPGMHAKQEEIWQTFINTHDFQNAYMNIQQDRSIDKRITQICTYINILKNLFAQEWSNASSLSIPQFNEKHAHKFNEQKVQFILDNASLNGNQDEYRITGFFIGYCIAVNLSCKLNTFNVPAFTLS